MTAFIRRYFAGGASATTLASSMSNSDTSFVINSSSGWPGSPGNPFYVVIDRGNTSEEKILCASNSGTTVTVTARGQDGTSATTHAANAPVEVCITGVDGDEANQVANLLGNAAAGSIFYGGGAGVLPSKLAIGAAGSILNSSGTAPQWLGIGSTRQFLSVSGGLPAWATGILVPTTQTANYNAADKDLVLISTGKVVTLPTAPPAGTMIGVIATDANVANGLTAGGTAVVKAPGLGSGTPAGTLVPLGAQDSGLVVVYDGTNWRKVAGNANSGWSNLTVSGWTGSGVQSQLEGHEVKLQGSLSAGTSGTQVTTLPVGQRPPTRTLLFPSGAVNGSAVPIPAAVQITTAGVVSAFFSGTLNNMNLDGITFTVD